MAIDYINIGTIANDGTGDDLREAFAKVNNNFEELDLRIVEETLITNAGTIGQGVYAGKSDSVHNFKRITSGSANLNITANDTSIIITAQTALSQLIAVTDNGTVTVQNGQTMSIRGGDGIQTRADGQDISITLADTNIVSRDTNPTLTADLDVNNNDVLNANVINASVFRGTLEGLVYGYDVRDFGSYLTGFDFGGIRKEYYSALHFILEQLDMEFGPITVADNGITVDLGFLPTV